MLDIHLSCLKAQAIPVVHCIQALCNVSSLYVHSGSGIPSRLHVRSGTNTEPLGTSSQEVTCWVIWEIWSPLIQKEFSLLNVSDPYQEVCALGTSGLHNGSEAEPYPDVNGDVGDLLQL